MIDSFTIRIDRSVNEQLRHNRARSWLGFAGLAGITLLVALMMVRGGPDPVLFAWLLYLAGFGAIAYQPRYGIYLMLMYTLLGDWIMLPWFPFWKNFSSAESIFYLNRALIFSPLESYIVATYLSWFARALAGRRLAFFRGSLLWPIVVFSAFVAGGFIVGMARGGNLYVALWEARPITYLPMLFVLTSNLIVTRKHVNALIWTLALALFGRAVIALVYLAIDLRFDFSDVERIGNHAMSIYFDSFYVLTIGVWLFRDTLAKRLGFLLMLPLMVYVFLANHRRSSFIALGIALLLIAYLLFQLNRRLFWRVVPALSLVVAVYFAVFWNSHGSLGYPVEAFKSIIGVPNERDAASNQYRVIENANLMYTLRAAPLGLGFGQKFYIIYPLPDISFFEWWEYIPHNSVLWIWLKTGPGGFLAMLFLFGMAIAIGARAIMTMPDGVLGAAALMATLYVLMHGVYMYVDIAWDLSSMVYVGAMIGLIDGLERIAATPEQEPVRRWSWP